jgi:hypothetical protein
MSNGRRATLAYVTAWTILALWTLGIVVDFVVRLIGDGDHEPNPIFAVLMPVVAVWLFDVTVPGIHRRDDQPEEESA